MSGTFDYNRLVVVLAPEKELPERRGDLHDVPGNDVPYNGSSYMFQVGTLTYALP